MKNIWYIYLLIFFSYSALLHLLYLNASLFHSIDSIQIPLYTLIIRIGWTAMNHELLENHYYYEAQLMLYYVSPWEWPISI